MQVSERELLMIACHKDLRIIALEEERNAAQAHAKKTDEELSKALTDLSKAQKGMQLAEDAANRADESLARMRTDNMRLERENQELRSAAGITNGQPDPTLSAGRRAPVS